MAYEGTPTWDIGRPQGAVVRLEESGAIAGRVLDVGCGTGENALYLAGRGHQVLGVDFAAGAIEKARAKAKRHVAAPRVDFLVRDALRLDDLGRTFDTILDVGLFHTLQPWERERYAASLRSAVVPGGHAVLLCWSERNPFGYGPARIRRADLRAAFRRGWKVEAIREEELESRLPSGSVHAWLAIVRPR